MEITIVHTLHPDVLKLLQGLLPQPAEAAQKTEKPAKLKQITMDLKEPSDNDTTTNGQQAPEITLELLRKTVQSKVAEGKRDQVKELLNTFSANSVSVLQKAKYQDFYAKAKDL
jgi:hypothetical protein